MGRPKLPRTKEQIAIRLAPGTKTRLAALLKNLAVRGAAPVRSDVLREAIERGLSAMEAELEAGASASRTGAARARAAAPNPPVAPAARPRAAPPPPRIPAPASVRRGPIPGTLADRALKRLEELSGQDRSRQVPLPQLCREAWPPNPARVRDAVNELAELGLVELLPVPSGTRLGPGDQDLVLHNSSRGILGSVRLR